jgi:hypothetical protein
MRLANSLNDECNFMGKKQATPKHYHEAPPVPEEPLETMQPSKFRCEICGKIFRRHTEVDRHMATEHESPEGRERI